jgi:CRP/FNR family transcriptional regulator
MAARKNDKSEGTAVPDSRKQEILERYSFYRDAGQRLKSDIERVAMLVQADTGTHFFDRGMSCAQVALVGEGSVRVFISSESGREITLYRVNPGETCPVNLLTTMLARVAPATAVIESPLTAVALPSDIFRRWVSEEPGIRQFVFEAIAIRMVDILTLLEEITFGKLDRRLAEFLMRRAGNGGKRAPVIEMTHEQIAVELSTAREVVSRLLRDFERTGAVELARGRVHVRDPNALQALVS